MRLTAEDVHYHVARILLLLLAFRAADDEPFEGLTKLAKLDFLLRYPLLMREFLETRGCAVATDLMPTAREQVAVESPMIRYRFGPWDQRYYTVIGRMVGTGLVYQGRGAEKQVLLSLTAAGRERAIQVSTMTAWTLTWKRAELLAEALRDLSGHELKSAIYEQFEELMDRPHWSVM